MRLTYYALIGAISLIGSAATASTIEVSAGFSGDLCDTGATATCDSIPGNAGTVGSYDFVLSGLDTNVSGPGTISLTSTLADLFRSAGENNAFEVFRLFVDGMDFGLLFDSTIVDESAVNASLGQSVADNIAASTGSAAPIDVSFTIDEAEFAALIADGELVVTTDFSEATVSSSVNSFVDPIVTVTYDVDVAAVPLPASALLLLAGMGGLAAMRRARKS